MPQRSRFLPWAGLILRAAAAAVWLVAGLAKVTDLAAFRLSVEHYELLPHGMALPFAYLLPFLEFAIGLYLAAGLFLRAAAWTGTLLMALFLVAEGQAWARGLPIDCGCFGTIAQATVGPVTIGRDLALALPTLLMALWPARFVSVDRLLGRRADGAASRSG